MLNFKLVEDKDKEYVEFIDFVQGKTGRNFQTRIQKNAEGNEYCIIPNVYSSNEDVLLQYSFHNMPGDAIKSIFDGYGDTLMQGELFESGDQLKAVMFLDRVIGEQMRAKTMEGFKNTTWKYGIRLCNRFSLSSGNFISNSYKENLFSTREEAENRLAEMKKAVDIKIDEIIELEKVDSKKFDNAVCNIIDNKYKMLDVYFAMISTRQDEKTHERVKDYCFDVAQKINTKELRNV